MAPRPPKPEKSAARLDDLIADPVVQMTLKADGIAEQEFREILRAAGWRMASKRDGRSPPGSVTADGASVATEYRRGVGVMLLNRDGNVFVGRRIDVGGEAWQMPQGGIEPGEEPLDAAWRELKEEIGTAKAELIAESAGWYRYDLPPNLVEKARHGRWRGQLQKWFVMRFLGSDDEIDVDTVAPEFSAWKWVPPAEVPLIVVEFKRRLYRDLMAEFGNRTGGAHT
jgi:putative (di)nucleoside polyphosphate hydrolase